MGCVQVQALKNQEWANTILSSFQYQYEGEDNQGYKAFLSLSDGASCYC